MKKNACITALTFILLIALVICTSCSTLSEPDNTTNIYKMTPAMCKTMFSCTPQEFCDSNGAKTLVKNNFLSAVMDENGNLILELSDEQKEYWLARSLHMQVFYTMLSHRDGEPPHPFISGLTDSLRVMLEEQIKSSKRDMMGKIFIDGAAECNFDIAEDYSKITVPHNGDIFNITVMTPACIHMQLISGVDSNDIRVEIVYLDENGSVKSTDVWASSNFE